MSGRLTKATITFFKDGEVEASKLDKENGVKNCFSWKWMQETVDQIGRSLGKNEAFSQKIGDSFS